MGCAREDPPEKFHEAFQRHGFVVIRGFLELARVNEVSSQLESFISSLPTLLEQGDVPPGHIMRDHAEYMSTLKQIQQLHLHETFFADLAAEELKPLCEVLLAEPASIKNLQYFNKPALSSYPAGSSGSKETPPHQDGYYFMIKPQSATTMWLALDPADDSNGCIRYVLGSSQRELRRHDFTGIYGFSQGISDFGGSDMACEVSLEAMPGDLIVHNSLMIHRAPPNSTLEQPRRAIGAIFYGESAKVDQEAYNERQAEIRRRASQLEGQSASSVTTTVRRRKSV